MAQDLRDQVRKSLLDKKGGSKQVDQWRRTLLRIKSKNDAFSKQAGTQMQSEMVQQINKQVTFLKKELTQLRSHIQRGERNMKDPQSKRSIKQLKQDILNQTERTSRLIKEFIVKSFVRKSLAFGKTTAESARQQNDLLADGGAGFQTVRQSVSEQDGLTKEIRMAVPRQVMLQDTIDYDIQQRLREQRQEVIDKAEKQILDLKEVIIQTAKMVQDQGQQIQQISEHVQKTHKNVLISKEEAEQAERLQRSGCCCSLI